MRIVIQSKLSRGAVQEGSAMTLTAKFYDDASDPWTLSAPSTVRYRIDDMDTGAGIVDWTTVSPATSVSISITGAQNALQSQSENFERHEITVQANANLSTQYSETYSWKVLNIAGIT
jgi:hypothetical protein